MGTLRPLALPEDCLAFLFFVSPVERKTMKAMTFDKSFAEKKDTFANLIANLSRMVLTTSERLFYIKLLTRGFRSTFGGKHIYKSFFKHKKKTSFCISRQKR